MILMAKLVEKTNDRIVEFFFIEWIIIWTNNEFNDYNKELIIVKLWLIAIIIETRFALIEQS